MNLPDNEENSTTNAKWYEQTWFIVILLIFVSPLGLFLIWRSAKFSFHIKVFVTVVLGATILFAPSKSNKEPVSN